MAAPRFNAHPFNLSDDGSGEPRSPSQLSETRTAREAKIFELLRADDDATIRAKAVDRIERALGAYTAFVENVDGAPTASEYSKAYLAIATKARELFWLLDGLDHYIAESLDAQLDANAIINEQNSLANLVRVSDESAKRYKADSGGRPEQHAEPYAVATLRAIFREYYRGETKPRGNRAFEKFAPWESAELEFVSFALKFIGVSPNNLPRKMRDDTRYMPIAMGAKKLADAKKISAQRAVGARGGRIVRPMAARPAKTPPRK